MIEVAARFLVSGRVQGVWFRAHTRQQAQGLGLRGFARNLKDGTVEVLAAGSPAAIDAIEAWLWVGSPESRVEKVIRSTADLPPLPGFDVG